MGARLRDAVQLPERGREREVGPVGRRIDLEEGLERLASALELAGVVVRPSRAAQGSSPCPARPAPPAPARSRPARGGATSSAPARAGAARRRSRAPPRRAAARAPALRAFSRDLPTEAPRRPFQRRRDARKPRAHRRRAVTHRHEFDAKRCPTGRSGPVPERLLTHGHEFDQNQRKSRDLRSIRVPQTRPSPQGLAETVVLGRSGAIRVSQTRLRSGGSNQPSRQSSRRTGRRRGDSVRPGMRPRFAIGRPSISLMSPVKSIGVAPLM